MLGGVATGLLIGVLFVPEKGSRTRKRIADKAGDFTDDLKEKFDDMVGNLTDKYESIMEEAKNLSEREKSKLKEAAKNADHVMA